MKSRNFARVVSLAASVVAVALVAGCGAAPGDESAASTDEALLPQCTKAFTAQTRTCWTNSLGQNQCAMLCKSVTAAPQPTSDGLLPSSATTVDPPDDLAALGCTYGLYVTQYDATGYVWACPAANASSIPSTYGCATAPSNTISCATFSETSVDPNPFVGNPNAGWVVVIEDFEHKDGGGGGSCQGGCALQRPPSLTP